MDAVISETANPAAKIKIPGERSLLIVEDDQSFSQRLAKALEQRGFIVTTANLVADGLLQVEKVAPAYAVVDMRLDDGNGLDVISALKNRRPDARAIILTGYGNIATAVNAVKLRIGVAASMGIGWWITSALESNIGLNAICQYTASHQYKPSARVKYGAYLSK